MTLSLPFTVRLLFYLTFFFLNFLLAPGKDPLGLTSGTIDNRRFVPLAEIDTSASPFVSLHLFFPKKNVLFYFAFFSSTRRRHRVTTEKLFFPAGQDERTQAAQPPLYFRLLIKDRADGQNVRMC